MWTQVITGIIGGLAYSLSGLAKKESRESFSWIKMLPTIIVGGVVGIVAGFTNQDYGVVVDTAGIAGVTAFVENIWKALYRKAF